MLVRKLTLAASAATLAIALLPAAASATDVCNEAENSHQRRLHRQRRPGRPEPAGLPARLADARRQRPRQGPRVNAAVHSPALRTCGPTATAAAAAAAAATADRGLIRGHARVAALRLL